MFPIINIGPAAIQASGLILLLSLFAGTWLTSRLAVNLGTNADTIENSILFGLLAGLLGARLGFLLINPSVFVSNPLSVLSLTPSMLDASFGVLVGILTGLIIAQKKLLPLWPTLDTLSPLVLLVFIGYHLANYAVGNAYGIETELSWGVQLWNSVRHPVQLYAVLLGTGLFIWLLQKTRLLTTTGFDFSGVLFNVVLAGLALITLFTQAFRAERILLGSLDFTQLLAFLLMLGALGMIYRRVFPRYIKKSILISVGANIDPQQQHHKALDLINEKFRIRRKSSLYQSLDVKGNRDAQQFLNRVLEIESELPYLELISQLKSIEKTLGRQAGNKVQVALDLDVLTFGNEVFVKGRHHIPAADLIKYRYIAVPLAEMAPDFRHPASGIPIQRILEEMPDTAEIKPISEV